MLDQPYLDAIKGFEGYTPNASWDYKQYSSGYGTKAEPGDENIPPDQLKAIHEQRFGRDIGNAEASVNAFAPGLSPGRLAALIDLTHNTGTKWQQSGLGEAVKAGDWERAAQIFTQYNKAGGEVLPGLVTRRAWGANLLRGGDIGQPSAPAALAATAAAPRAPLQLAQQAPIFPAQPQALAQPYADGGSGGGSGQQNIFSQMQPPQAPPIYYAPRRSPDLSKLRAAFQSPIFPRG